MRALLATAVLALASCEAIPLGQSNSVESWPSVHVEGATVADATDAITRAHDDEQFKSFLVRRDGDTDSIWATKDSREVYVQIEHYGPLPSDEPINGTYHYVVEPTPTGVSIRGSVRLTRLRWNRTFGGWDNAPIYESEWPKEIRRRLDLCASLVRVDAPTN